MTNAMKSSLILLFLLTVICLSALTVNAQEVAPTADAGAPIPMGIVTPAADGAIPPDAGQAAATPTAPAPVDPAIPGGINPNDIPSLVFTYWEHTAIEDAKRSRGLVRPPTEEELMRDLKTRGVDKPMPPPEEREIRLGGIVYVKSGDWTIWLNDKRVTPKAIPAEVMDLKVSKEYIEMKWFDEYTNQIFPIRLRPHQRFNIDTRIFLPG